MVWWLQRPGCYDFISFYFETRHIRPDWSSRIKSYQESLAFQSPIPTMKSWNWARLAHPLKSHTDKATNSHTHKLAHQQDSDVLYLVSFQLKNRPTQRKFALFALPKSVEEREYHNSGTHKLRLRRRGEASDKMQRSAGKKLWAWTFGVLILWGGWFCVWQSVLCSMVVVVWWVWESRFRCGHQVTLGLLGPWTRLRSHLWAHLGLVWSGRVYFGLLLHLVDLVGLFCWLANTFL